MPPGEYLSGSLFLPSRVRLYLEAGSTIYASTRPEDCQNGSAHLITARGAEYVVLRTDVMGPGVFNPVFHEYAHYAMRQVLAGVPLWLAEGDGAEAASEMKPPELSIPLIQNTSSRQRIRKVALPRD